MDRPDEESFGKHWHQVARYLRLYRACVVDLGVDKGKSPGIIVGPAYETYTVEELLAETLPAYEVALIKVPLKDFTWERQIAPEACGKPRTYGSKCVRMLNWFVDFSGVRHAALDELICWQKANWLNCPLNLSKQDIDAFLANDPIFDVMYIRKQLKEWRGRKVPARAVASAIRKVKKYEALCWRDMVIVNDIFDEVHRYAAEKLAGLGLDMDSPEIEPFRGTFGLYVDANLKAEMHQEAFNPGEVGGGSSTTGAQRGSKKVEEEEEEEDSQDAEDDDGEEEEEEDNSSSGGLPAFRIEFDSENESDPLGGTGLRACTIETDLETEGYSEYSGEEDK